MVRIQPTAQLFRVAQQKTLEATRQILIQTAQREHAKVMATDPKPTSFTRVVDGRRGAALESVKPDGVITFLYPRLDAVAQFAMETLFDLSPVLTGEYRNSHTLFLNGVAVPNLKDYQQGDQVMIANFLPYSRKIELGVMQMRVPGTDQVYEQAVSKVNKRYGNIAKCLFTFTGIVGGAAARGRIGNRSENRYPAILIRKSDACREL